MDYLDEWRRQVLDSSWGDSPTFERKVLVFVQTSHGTLDAVLELSSAYPCLGEFNAIVFNGAQHMSHRHACAEAERLLAVSGLTLGRRVNYVCENCHNSIPDNEGPCPHCEQPLEITAVEENYCTPLPADANVPVPSASVKVPVWHRLWRNWPIHNIFAHPLAGVLDLLRLSEWSEAVHDMTVPPDERDRG